MKKLIVFVLTMLTCGAGYALPLGNPTEASQFLNGAWLDTCCDSFTPCFNWCDVWNLRLGFYGDYVFNRHMEVIHTGPRGGKNIRQTTIFTNAGYLALNIYNRLDIFATLGTSKLQAITNQITWNEVLTDVRNTVLSFETAFSWSAGARATLWQYKRFGLGIEGQYFQTSPNADYFDNSSPGNGFISHFNNQRAKYLEWQFGLGASYRIASRSGVAFIPYAGVKWSKARFILGNDPFRFDDFFRLRDLRSDRPWGYAAGATLTLLDMVGVTVEGRWANEKAVYVNGQFRF